MNVKNLAQGDFVIAGGYVSWYLVQNGFPALLGVPVAFVVMWGIGWVVYKLVISRVIERDLFTSLLATFGLAIMMAQILNLLFGSDTQSVDLDYDVLYFFDGFIDVPIAKLIGVLMASALAAGVIIFMKSSRMGQAIRATAQGCRRGHHRHGLGDPAVLWYRLLDTSLCHRHRGRPRQPARRYRGGPRHRCAGTVRCAYIRHRLPAGDSGIAIVAGTINPPDSAAT
jgi:hypothetical protein